jgi:uracil-DNA glycosylase family 4
VEKRRAFRDEEDWGRPVPGFGDPGARVLLVGLAPAAHGANRTGRVFTGDGVGGSGDFLMAALHRAGFANLPTSRHAADGLRLRGTFIAAAVRCAPPANKPTPTERDACAPYLARELDLLRRVRVLLALGAYGWDAALRAMAANGERAPVKPRFGHGAMAEVGKYRLIASYHPSQQNTFTGTLAPAMLDAVLATAKDLALS